MAEEKRNSHEKQVFFTIFTKAMANSLRKYTFGFRAGSKLQAAVDKENDTTLGEATISTLKDTAKSTGSIYVSRTLFSSAKLWFLNSALGSALMSSALLMPLRTFSAFLLTSFHQTVLGVMFTSFTATVTLSFTTIATMLLTGFAGSQLGKVISTTFFGRVFFDLCRFLVSVTASVLPLVIGSMVLGFGLRAYQRRKK